MDRHNGASVLAADRQLGKIACRRSGAVTVVNKIYDFDHESFIAKHGGGTISKYKAGQTIYAQGDAANALFYIIRGTVKTVITSEFGKDAVITLLGDHDFFGEGCWMGIGREGRRSWPSVTARSHDLI
jgi:CRP-like cAMP-binding protein